MEQCCCTQSLTCNVPKLAACVFVHCVPQWQARGVQLVAEDARVGFDAAIPFAHNVAHTVHREGGHLQNMADGTDIMSMQSARGVLTATAAPTHICSRFPFKQVPARGVSHLEEVWVQFYRLVNKVFARGNGWKLFPVQQLLARPGLV